MFDQLTFHILLLSFAAYVSGSIPFGLIMARLFTGTDIRKVGSGNTGMVNTFRAAGPTAAGLTFVLDGVKGFVPVFVAAQLDISAWVLLFPAALAIAGHNWSLFLRGTGGKGVATSVGVIAAIAPVVALIGIGLWIFVVFSSRYASLASLLMLAAFPALLTIFDYNHSYAAFGIGLTILAIYSHRQNIIRLWEGTELKLSRPRRPATESGD